MGERSRRQTNRTAALAGNGRAAEQGLAAQQK